MSTPLDRAKARKRETPVGNDTVSKSLTPANQLIIQLMQSPAESLFALVALTQTIRAKAALCAAGSGRAGLQALYKGHPYCAVLAAVGPDPAGFGHAAVS